MTRRRTFAIVAAAAAGLVLSACGGEDDSPAASGDTRTVEVDMVDIAFEPDTLTVAEGETIRFLFTNGGKVAHDAFIGDADAQAAHEAEMADGDSGDAHGGHGAADDDALTVEPGDTAELAYAFDEPGSVEIGCHQPGHYESGMKVTVEVA